MPRLIACIVAMLAATAGPARAQDPSAAAGPSTERAGILRTIAERGRISLGHREDALPFSHRGLRRPVGYSIDLCLAVVDALRLALRRDVVVDWRVVTSESRIPELLSGNIDLECGSTTINAERERHVSFSPVIFVAGTRLLVHRDSPVREFADLAGRSVVATAGTTNAEAVRELAARERLTIDLVTEADHAQSFARLATGKADAFAGDDVLLHGLIASAPTGEAYRITGPPLSLEPYALMFRRDDPAFAALIRGTFERLARDGVLKATYARWFTWHLPSGGQMALPMDPQLVQLHRELGAPD